MLHKFSSNRPRGKKDFASQILKNSKPAGLGEDYMGRVVPACRYNGFKNAIKIMLLSHGK